MKIKRAKLKDYLLDPVKSKGKSAIFNSIGYTQSYWKQLVGDLRQGLKTADLKFTKIAKDGSSLYKANMELGRKGKMKTLTVWAVKDNKGQLHLVTAYEKGLKQ